MNMKGLQNLRRAKCLIRIFPLTFLIGKFSDPKIQLAGFPQDVHWPDEAETTGSKDGMELKEIFDLHLYCLFFLSFVLLLVLLHIVNLIYLLFSFVCFFFLVVYFLTEYTWLFIYLFGTGLFQIQLLYSDSDPMPPHVVPFRERVRT